MKRLGCFFFYVFLSIFLSGCINTSIRGIWSIDTIQYEEQDLRFDIVGNLIQFERGDCRLIFVKSKAFNAGNSKAKWKTSKRGDKYYITFDTDNEVFVGTHEVCFYLDYREKLLKMVISSKDLYMVATKGSINFNRLNKHDFDDFLCGEQHWISSVD